jgi:hypothetical protein
MTEINIKLPIKISKTENDGYVITDAQDSEYFFFENKKTGFLVYDGCCVNVENKDIVLNQIKSQ